MSFNMRVSRNILQCSCFGDTLRVLEIIAIPSPFVRGEVGDIDMIGGDRQLALKERGQFRSHLAGSGRRRRAEGLYFDVSDVLRTFLE